MALTEIRAGQFLIDSGTKPPTPWRLQVVCVDGGWAQVQYFDTLEPQGVTIANVRQLLTYYTLLHDSVDAAHDEALSLTV